MEAPHGEALSVHADAVVSPRGGPQRRQGLADPVVFCFLEIAGQDSLLVLQLLRTKHNGNAVDFSGEISWSKQYIHIYSSGENQDPT